MQTHPFIHNQFCFKSKAKNLQRLRRLENSKNEVFIEFWKCELTPRHTQWDHHSVSLYHYIKF